MKEDQKKYTAYFSYDAVLGRNEPPTPLHGRFASKSYFKVRNRINILLDNIREGTCTIVFQNTG